MEQLLVFSVSGQLKNKRDFVPLLTANYQQLRTVLQMIIKIIFKSNIKILTTAFGAETV